jgi:tetratricopeptide (TPR) repeat protein
MTGMQTVSWLLLVCLQPLGWDDAIRVKFPPKSHDRMIASLTGQHVEAYSIQEIGYQFKEDYDKAVKELSEAIRADPKDAISYNNRGLAYRAKRTFEKALKDLSEAIRLDPNNPAAYNNRGELYTAKREYQKAIKDLTKALNLDSMCDEALENRGRAYLRNKDYGLAVVDLTQAIRVRSDFAEACLFLHRGLAYAAQGNSDDAISDFSTAIAIDMRLKGLGYLCPQAYLCRGIAYVARKKYHLGFDDLKEYLRAIAENPSEWD